MLERFLNMIWEEHRGKTIGVVIGLLAAILFLSFGFWKTIFIIVCIVLGYILGKRIDEDKNFDQWIRKIFRDS
ncbi:MAG TPA: DUF2273 domain-containing protein [Syntrophomonadaceae bacterium]|jgi:uncharacterized membrane protein|nr:DUF2273 domain-containing protein [Syntrophomonadaceae bacterium]